MTIQVDQLRLSYKNPCRIATTTAIVLATTGLTDIDGITPVAGDRVLVKDQSAGAENGIYIAATTTWARALDFNTTSADSLQAGLTTRVQEGTAGAGNEYYLATTGTIILDTTSLSFIRVAIAIGADVQAWDADLDTLAGLAKTDSNLIVGNGSAWVAESGATLRTSIGLGTGDSPTFAALDIIHTATEVDDHALEIDANAAGFGDVKALDINYITGAIGVGSDEAVILANIDESSATGGDVTALEVLTTEGSADIFGLFAGALVNPIKQLSGTFANADSFLVIAVDQLTAVSGGGAGDIAIFDNDNDTITIGSSTKFEELEFLLDTGASAAGIAPVFDFSTGVGTWATFTPTDGTNAFRNTGIVAWLDGNIPSWATGTGTEYLIRITRTRNTLTTTPIVDKVQIAATVEYSWNKDGQLTVADLTLTSTGNAIDLANGASIQWSTAGTRIEGSGAGGGAVSIHAVDRIRFMPGGFLAAFMGLANHGAFYQVEWTAPAGIAGFGATWMNSADSRPWFTDDTSVDFKLALELDRVHFVAINTPSGGLGKIENLLTFSENLVNATWVHNGGWGDSTGNHIASPTGEATTTRTRILAADAAGSKLLRHNITLTNSATYTLSFWAKRGSVSAATLQLNGDLGDGTSFGVQTLTTTWEYFSFAMTAGTLDHLDFDLIGHDSITNSEFFIWGVTIQNGDVNEPYMRTTDAISATYGGITNGDHYINGDLVLTKNASKISFWDGGVEEAKIEIGVTELKIWADQDIEFYPGNVFLAQFTDDGALRLIEQSSAPGTNAGSGYIWIENNAPTTLTYTDDVSDTFHVGGQIKIVADPGDAAAIPVTGSARIYITTGASGETNTLANPTEEGHVLILSLDTDGGGNRVITADSIINDNGNTIMTFGEVGETIMLRSTMIRITGADNFFWMVIGGIGGVGLS